MANSVVQNGKIIFFVTGQVDVESGAQDALFFARRAFSEGRFEVAARLATVAIHLLENKRSLIDLPISLEVRAKARCHIFFCDYSMFLSIGCCIHHFLRSQTSHSRDPCKLATARCLERGCTLGLGCPWHVASG